MGKAALRSIGLVLVVLAQTGVLAGTSTVEKTDYKGMEAYRLSDGRSQAVVVPSLGGRVMSYGLVGGYDFLWNAKSVAPGYKGWINYGGDRTAVAPQMDWMSFFGDLWPPDMEWDNGSFDAEITFDRRLLLQSRVSAKRGAMVSRILSMDDKGELVIEQKVEKISGEPRLMSLWNITQVIPPDAVFLPCDPASAYRGGYYICNTDKQDPKPSITRVSPGLLRVRHTMTHGYKLGVDSPSAGIAAVKDGVAFVERAPHPEGRYPDGGMDNGFPVEMFNDATAADPYMEIELLSPLTSVSAKATLTHTLRWSLHQLPSKDVKSKAVGKEMEKLLTVKVD